MDKICSGQLLKGRPFGGVGVLVHKRISTKVKVVGFHPDSRVIAITIDHNNLQLLCFGVYLPYGVYLPHTGIVLVIFSGLLSVLLNYILVLNT